MSNIVLLSTTLLHFWKMLRVELQVPITKKESVQRVLGGARVLGRIAG